MQERKVPAQVMADPTSREFLRAWVVGDVNVFVSYPNLGEDPACWGLFLVDIARHVAHALSQEREDTCEKILSRIKEGFDAEWEVNTNSHAPAAKLLTDDT